MADISPLYPPTPPGIPADLTTPSSSYRFRVVVVLLCLFVFVGVYLGLTAGSAYACYACFAALVEDDPKPAPAPTYSQTGSYPQTGSYRGQRSYTPPPQTRPARNTKPVFWLIVGGIMSGLLFLFLVKGL